MKKLCFLTITENLICGIAANSETLLTDSSITYFLDGTKSLRDRTTRELDYFNDEKMCNIKTEFNRLSLNITTYP